MKDFIDYFSDTAIVNILCRHRAKISHKRHKKHMMRDISLHNRTNKIKISDSDIEFKTVQSFFDDIFLNCSYAFRAKKQGKIPSHHDSVIEILKYRKRYKKLWVSECDIQKFYDTVQHEYLISIFDELAEELKEKGIHISDISRKLFLLFLKSYSFSEDVYPKNQSPIFFQENGVFPGKFGWVEDELNSTYSEDYTKKYKIGVPQGNAVSCFIANLIMHRVDKLVKEVSKDIFYVRYCDDMILAHPRKETCLKALEIYQRGIKSSYLLYHEPQKFVNYKNSPKEFWEAKSKQPYYWGNKYVGYENIPWLSFVGYQINYNGEIRVRKYSLHKEIKKQIAETQNILKSLGLDGTRNLKDINEYSRKSKTQIIFSLQQRLISMSVGRVTILNYKEGKQGLCWTNGFKLLRNNKITVKQLKYLDRRREQQISYLKRQIDHLKKEVEDTDVLPDYMDDIYFGLPYSYYNHLLQT